MIVVDDSYFPTDKNFKEDNANVVACVFLPEESKETIVDIFEEVMIRNGLKYLPLKYCIDGLKKEYEVRGHLKEYDLVLKKKRH